MCAQSGACRRQSNGSAENAVKQVKGQFRTLKTSTEDRYRCKIDAKSFLLAWIPRHCANPMTRFKRYSDGRTAIQRLTGRRWGRPMVVFGERLLVKVAVSRAGRRAGLESAFIRAVFVGHHGRSGALMALTGSGERPQFHRESTRERSFHRLRIGEVEGVTLESTRFLGGATGRWAGCPGNSNSACTNMYATTSTKNPRERMYVTSGASSLSDQGSKRTASQAGLPEDANVSFPQGTKRVGLESTEPGMEPDARRQKITEGTASTVRNDADSDVQVTDANASSFEEPSSGLSTIASVCWKGEKHVRRDQSGS